jgi:hypothetical protein
MVLKRNKNQKKNPKGFTVISSMLGELLGPVDGGDSWCWMRGAAVTRCVSGTGISRNVSKLVQSPKISCDLVEFLRNRSTNYSITTTTTST